MMTRCHGNTMKAVTESRKESGSGQHPNWQQQNNANAGM